MDEEIRELFQCHLANRNDPNPTIELIKRRAATIQFLDEFIFYGEIQDLTLSDQLQVLTMLGIWCPEAEVALLEKWVEECERQDNFRRVLRVQISMLRGKSKAVEDDPGRANETAADQLAGEEGIRELFDAHSANQKDPAIGEEIKKRRIAAIRFFDKLISSGGLAGFSTQRKTALLVNLATWCGDAAPALLDKWLMVESERVVQRLLIRLLCLLRAEQS